MFTMNYCPYTFYVFVLCCTNVLERNKQKRDKMFIFKAKIGNSINQASIEDSRMEKYGSIGLDRLRNMSID